MRGPLLRYTNPNPSPNPDQTSSLLAVELFQSADTVYNVAGRPGAPTASLAARATEHPIRSVLVVNLVIPAQEGYP